MNIGLCTGRASLAYKIAVVHFALLAQELRDGCTQTIWHIQMII